MRKRGSYVIAIAGLILLGTGLFLVKTLIDSHGIWKTLPYILVGLGCGVFGHGMGDLISKRTIKNHPEIQKK